jgi:DNA-binding CsgD family transcriptional regulator
MPLDPSIVERMHRKRKHGGLVPVGEPYDGGHETSKEREERLGSEEILLQRQFDVYELRAAGGTLREIASIMGISYSTVASDLEAEGARRTEALVAGTQDIKVAMSVTRYEGVIARTLNRLATGEAQRIQLQNLTRRPIPPSRTAFLEEKIIIESQERIDRVLGLTRVSPVTDTAAGAASSEMNKILQTFADLPADVRLQLLTRARKVKKAQAQPPSDEQEEATG